MAQQLRIPAHSPRHAQPKNPTFSQSKLKRIRSSEDIKIVEFKASSPESQKSDNQFQLREQNQRNSPVLRLNLSPRQSKDFRQDNLLSPTSPRNSSMATDNYQAPILVPRMHVDVQSKQHTPVYLAMRFVQGSKLPSDTGIGERISLINKLKKLPAKVKTKKDFLTRNQSYIEQKRNQSISDQQQRLQNETKDCTFSPRINKSQHFSSPQISPRLNTTADRTYSQIHLKNKESTLTHDISDVSSIALALNDIDPEPIVIDPDDISPWMKNCFKKQLSPCQRLVRYSEGCNSDRILSKSEHRKLFNKDIPDSLLSQPKKAQKRPARRR